MTAEAVTDMMTGARRETANAAYDAARAASGPVNLNDAIGTIDTALGRDPILGETALKQSEIGRRLTALRGQLQNDGEQLIDFDRVLNIKSDLGEQIRRMRGDAPPVLVEVHRALDQALEASSSAYRAANDQYRAASNVIDAIPVGQKSARTGRYEDVLRRFNNMTPEEQTAFRAGYGDKLAAELEGNRAAAPDVTRVFRGDKRAAETAAIAKDPELLARQVAREGDMYGVFDRALRGSRTADNQVDIADLTPMGNIVRALGDAWSGNFSSAAQTAGSVMAPLVTGQNQGTRKLIADMLMSPNPKAFLEEALQKQGVSDATARVIEALLRNAGREPGADITTQILEGITR